MNFVYWVNSETFSDMAAISAKSVRRVYPQARVFCYSDHLYESSKQFDEVMVLPDLFQSPIMVANLRCQVHFCLTHGLDEPTWFLDTDVLAVQAHLAAPVGDLLVTQRDHVAKDEKGNKILGEAQNMPYNYGVMCAHGEGGKEALIWLRERIAKLSPQLQQWYGNQWALRDLVGGAYTDPTPRQVCRKMPWGQIWIKVENCDQWNYTPEKTDEDLSQVYFLHCKGKRKESLFDHYAEQLT